MLIFVRDKFFRCLSKILCLFDFKLLFVLVSFLFGGSLLREFGGSNRGYLGNGKTLFRVRSTKI